MYFQENTCIKKTEHIILLVHMIFSIVLYTCCKKKIRLDLDNQNLEEIIETINAFQGKLDSYKVDIQAYALLLAKFSIKNKKSLDKEIISRSQNWDSTRITLMDKLILRLVLAEIIFVDHVPPKVSIAEGIEIA